MLNQATVLDPTSGNGLRQKQKTKPVWLLQQDSTEYITVVYWQEQNQQSLTSSAICSILRVLSSDFKTKDKQKALECNENSRFQLKVICKQTEKTQVVTVVTPKTSYAALVYLAQLVCNPMLQIRGS